MKQVILIVMDSRFTYPIWFCCTFFMVISLLSCEAQIQESTTPPPFLNNESKWADSLLSTLTIEEKIGQLFMVAAYSNKDSSHENEILSLINEHHIGGLIFMQGGPLRQANMCNKFQQASDIPLMIAMDAEWGLGMRLDSTVSFPRQMTLGASNDTSLVYNFGVEAARQLKRMGVQVSFSPVVDVNNNPRNPVIGNRSFGENRELVTELGLAYMKGLQDNGILANAKHFPGHGDTDKDSHQTLPTILHNRARLDSVELYPFKKLINNGLGSMMIAHLFIPALDPTPQRASTLSPLIVDSLLRKEMGFEGLIFTDALNMKGVSEKTEPGELDLQALLAGNDVLLFPGNVPKAVDLIKLAVDSGLISQQKIDEHCLRILKTKQWCGLSTTPQISTQNLWEDLNSNQASATERRIAEASVTVLQNKDELLPLGQIDSLRIAVLSFGGSKDNEFNKTVKRYTDAKFVQLPKNPDFNVSQRVTSDLSKYDLVICNLLETSNRRSKNYGISNQSLRIINTINASTKTIVNVFANPYSIASMPGCEKIDALILGYQDHDMTLKVVAEGIFGASSLLGTLPVNVNAQYKFGDGFPIDKNWRIKHTTPEYLGIDASRFDRIDSLALNGIKEQAYPGCRVMVVKSGNVIFNKSYGHHTYEEKIKVNDETVYDLASITKIVSTTAIVMHMSDKGMINLDYNLCDYLPIEDTSAYFNMNLRQMLTHSARLKPWIPFYSETLNAGELSSSVYRKKSNRTFGTQVAKGLYIRNNYRDSIMQRILRNPLREKSSYRYSDLGYYFFQEIIENEFGKPIDEVADSLFYTPLSLQYLGYHPLKTIEKNQITPTEYDLFFRKQLVHGYVHDPGAAMIGGAGGHAGVFSTAEDLAVMMEMYLNNGEYAGKKYLNTNTLQQFTSCQFCDDDNRRAIGFDRPASQKGKGPTCEEASNSSFGHSGFTGTLTWADPEEDLVYVFLSNRVYPNAENRKLINMNIRTDIQKVIYQAIDPDFKLEIEPDSAGTTLVNP